MRRRRAAAGTSLLLLLGARAIPGTNRVPVARRSLARDALVRPHDSSRVHPPVSDAAGVPRYTPVGHRAGHRRRARLVGRVDHGQDRRPPTRSRIPTPRAASRHRWHPGRHVPPDPARHRRRRRTLFQTFCAVCHGAAGDAKGPVSPRIGAPSLLTARARAYSDGYIYSIIRYGRGVMPRYGDKVYCPFDRWAIVNHVRKLQAQAPAPPEAPGAAVGIPPAPSALGSTGGRPKMSPTVHQRIVQRAVAGRYRSSRPRRRARHPRRHPLHPVPLRRETRRAAWQLFHVNWLFFTGLSAGSVAFVGGAEDHQRQVVGRDDPVRRGERSAFLPVSLLGAAADLHRGISGRSTGR